MPSTPKLLRYSSGFFKLVKEELPEAIKNDNELHTKVLVLLYNKYANKSWGNTLPTQRYEEMNNYVYTLLEEYFE